MTNTEDPYQSWTVKGSYLNRMIDCGRADKNKWVEIALGYLPFEIFEELKEDLVFVAFDDMLACRLSQQQRQREVILVSNRLFPPAGDSEGDLMGKFFVWAILHEIAHAKCKHKNGKYDGISNEENESQEREADDLAYEWFNKHVSNVDNPYLLPITGEEVNDAKSRFPDLD